MQESRRYSKTGNLIIIILVSIALFKGCYIYTPYIDGVVLDVETKKPVADAWISAGSAGKSYTVGGDTSSGSSLDIPHTRTNKDGKFTISPHFSIRFLPPFLFGRTLESVGIIAETIDDREGQYSYKNFELTMLVWKLCTHVTIYVRLIALTNHEYADYLGGLSHNTEKYDKWEMNFIITKHERYLDQTMLKSDDNRSDYIQVSEKLGSLYEKQGNIEKTLELYTRAHNLKKQYGLLYKWNNYEEYIEKLKSRINRGNK